MPEIGPAIGLAIDPLEIAGGATAADLASADLMEREAAALRVAAHANLDTAIETATMALLDLSNGDPPVLPRDLLAGVLLISQHKPSRVTWSGAPDIAATLGA